MKIVSTTQLIALVAKTTKLPASQVKSVLAATFPAIQTQVKRGHKVALSGFGSFTRVARKARQGRDPLTKARIQIPATRTVKYTVGKAFLDVVAAR